MAGWFYCKFTNPGRVPGRGRRGGTADPAPGTRAKQNLNFVILIDLSLKMYNARREFYFCHGAV